MDNVILRSTLSLAWKLLVIYSVYILLRGHNDPGGGFIGGLLLALGIIIRRNILKRDHISSVIRHNFSAIMGALLLFFMLVVLFPVLLGKPILTGLWTPLWVPIAGKFSSVLVFDVMVYLVVSLSAIYANSVLSRSGGLPSAKTPAGDTEQ